jgi:predicted ABC-type ATPase
MRMFAGPNGSGKSTLEPYLSPASLGVYLNPDDIEQEINKLGFLDFSNYRINARAEEILAFFTSSAFLANAGYAATAGRLEYANQKLDFGKATVNSYFASVAVDFLRQKLLEQKISFTFETVMSHRSKVDLLAQARATGYRTYLYFISTDDPAINVSRVRRRVELGGHAVPQDRIEKRYHRSLDLLMDAIRHTNRAYIFDNSGENLDGKHTWLAEITDGKKLELKTNIIPSWFTQAVLNKINEPKKND